MSLAGADNAPGLSQHQNALGCDARWSSSTTHLDIGTPAPSLHPRFLPSSRSGLCCSSLVVAKVCIWGCMGVRGALDSKQSFKVFYGVLSTDTALLRSAMVLRAERIWESGWWATGALTLPAPRYFSVLASPWCSCCSRKHSPELPLNPFVAYV